MITEKISKKILLLLVMVSSFLFFTSSFSSCNEEDDAVDVIKLLINNDSLKVESGDTINLIKFYNAINHKRYYIVKQNIRISLIKVSNLDSDKEYNIYKGILHEDKPFIDSLIRTNFKTVPERFISKSCNECSAVDYYKLIVKNSRIKVVDKRELIDVFGYWSPRQLDDY